jgi:MoxR-like ATPase
MSRAVIGQEEAIDLLVAAALASGHVLLEGMPGVAKTLLATSLSQSMATQFARIQCTPELTPSDLMGGMREGPLGRQFTPGPIFTNVLLTDEINRATPKTQSALLEAMQERQVSLEGETYPLPDPFMVIATKNPIEYEGTYPLPEAQLDRFMFKVMIDYPPEADEVAMLNLPDVVAGTLPYTVPVLGQGELTDARRKVRSIELPEDMAVFIIGAVRRTRTHPEVRFGASPRAAVHLASAARAAAYLDDRDHVSEMDVASMANPVLRHRVFLQPEAELAGITTDDVVTSAVAETRSKL